MSRPEARPDEVVAMGLKWPSGGYMPWLWAFIFAIFVVVLYIITIGRPIM